MSKLSILKLLKGLLDGCRVAGESNVCGDGCCNGRVQSPNAQFTRDCEACRGAGFVLEPLIAKEERA